MAKRPRAAAPARGRLDEDTYEETEDQVVEGQDDDNEEGTEGSPDDLGTEQEAGEPEDLTDDDAGEDDEFDDEPPARQRGREPGRRDRRIETLAEENRRLREDLERSQRSSQPATPRAPAEETEEAFQQRMVLLDPEQRLNQTLARSQRQTQGMLQQMQMQTAIATDKAMFDAKTQSHVGYRAYATEIENEFQQLLRGDPSRGLPPQIVPRETLFQLILGREIAKGDPKALKVARRMAAAADPDAVDKARRQGQRRVAAQRTRPASARGDEASTRGTNAADTAREARRRRLENQTF